jgi:hypothetical protein
VPGFDLARVTYSATFFTGRLDGTMNTFGARQISPTAAKSRCGSQRSSLYSAGLATKNVVTISHV